MEMNCKGFYFQAWGFPDCSRTSEVFKETGTGQGRGKHRNST
jgi:hypothetical protein